VPNPTFFNLPEEKRNLIMQIAIAEFADNDYDSVSISRIVARAGIAKGSFYQYFADKDDLYAYLLQLIAEDKVRFFSMDRPDPQHIGIFAYLRWMAESSVAFELAHPQWVKIGLRALNNGKLPQHFTVRINQDVLAFYRRLVEVGQAQGDIDPAIDPELAAFMFDVVLSNLRELFSASIEKEGIHEYLGQQAFFDLPPIKRLFNQLIGILEQGMANRAKQETHRQRDKRGEIDDSAT
jgi:AcrR family transcriptional regulator